jgi:hypothetical protein
MAQSLIVASGAAACRACAGVGVVGQGRVAWLVSVFFNMAFRAVAFDPR